MSQMYYLQESRSFVGNSPVWWGKDCNGYVCDLDKAHLFTEDEAMTYFESRSTDIPWKQEDVEGAVKRLVDAQYLKKSDEDGFYTRLDSLKEAKRIEATKEAELYRIKEYKNLELFAIMENVSFENISGWTDFSSLFDETKGKMEWNEYHYPTAYNKHDEEIFNDLIENEFIFKCRECNKYFETHKRDGEHRELCDGCGEERWIKENPDED